MRGFCPWKGTCVARPALHLCRCRHAQKAALAGIADEYCVCATLHRIDLASAPHRPGHLRCRVTGHGWCPRSMATRALHALQAVILCLWLVMDACLVVHVVEALRQANGRRLPPGLPHPSPSVSVPSCHKQFLDDEYAALAVADLSASVLASGRRVDVLAGRTALHAQPFLHEWPHQTRRQPPPLTSASNAAGRGAPPSRSAPCTAPLVHPPRPPLWCLGNSNDGRVREPNCKR